MVPWSPELAYVKLDRNQGRFKEPKYVEEPMEEEEETNPKPKDDQEETNPKPQNDEDEDSDDEMGSGPDIASFSNGLASSPVGWNYNG